MKQIFISLLFVAGALCPMQAQNYSNDDETVGITVISDTTDTDLEVANADSIVDASINQAEQSIGITDMDVRISATDIMALLIPILVILLPALIIIITFYYIYKSRKAKYEVIKSAIEHGQELPQELIKKGTTTKGSNSEQQWRNGITKVFLGLGLTALLGILCGIKIGSIGILIFCIGLGQAFLAYFPTADKLKERISKQKTAAAEESTAETPETESEKTDE